MPAPLPLAAGLDWLEGILPLLFLLFWVVSQVRTLFGGGQPGKKAGPVAARPAPRPGDDADEARRELSRQIEELVRRATGERAGPRRAAATRPLESAAEQRQRPPSSRPRKPAPPTTGPRPPVIPPASPLRVERPLGSLGGHATDVARHVEGAFAHEIPRLAAGTTAPVAVTAPAAVAVQSASPAAASIAALVRDPATLRQLVLVREVLERPVDRW